MTRVKLPSVVDMNQREVEQWNLPPRVLLGPGPANIHPRVQQAAALPLVDHMDPLYLQMMDEIQTLLRYVWQTENEMTFPISGTGTAAMEAAIANVVEPGDVVLVGVSGYFGERLCSIARRHGAEIRRVDAEWGQVIPIELLEEEIRNHNPDIVALVHAETSTGAAQPIEGVGALCREHDALFLVDTVTSLGGMPLFIDAWEIDIAYSCSQKCIGSPPGLGPLTLNERAMEKVRQRTSPIQSWYLDLELLGRYWGEERVYHHTAPISLNYALREALRLVAEEGLSERWQRHQNNAELFWIGLQDLRLECHVDYRHRLPMLTTIRVPDGLAGSVVSRYIRENYNIAIAGGLGDLADRIWRVGLMGYNCRVENVQLINCALEEALLHAR